MLIQRLTIKQLGRPLFFCIHRVSAKLPEFFLLAHCVRCGGDSFMVLWQSYCIHRVVRITSGVFPPRSLCSLRRRLLQLCGYSVKGHAGILASHQQTRRNPRRRRQSRRGGIVPEWQRMTGEELNNRGLTLYPRGDPSG